MSKLPITPMSTVQDLAKHSDALLGVVIDSAENSSRTDNSSVNAVLATMVQRNNPAFVAGAYASAPLNWLKNKVFAAEDKPTNRRKLRIVTEGSSQQQQQIKSLQDAIATDANNPVLYSQLGRIYLETGNSSSALDCYSKGVVKLKDTDPTSLKVEMHKGRAISLIDSGNSKLAKRDLDYAIILAPQDSVLYRKRGVVFYETQGFRKSVADFQKVRDLEGAEFSLSKAGYTQDFAVEMKSFFSQGKFKQSSDLCNELIKHDPENGSLHYFKGLSLSYLKKPEEALKSFDQAIKLDPNDLEWRYQSGKTALTLNRPEEAIQHLLVAVKDPTRFTAQYELGNAYIKMGDYAKAFKAYDAALDLALNESFKENKGHVIFCVEQIAEKTSDFEASASGEMAQSLRKKLLQIIPDKEVKKSVMIEDSEDSLFSRVQKLIAGRKFKDALEACDELLEVNPNGPTYNYFKGLALTRLKKYEEASKSFDRALELNYDNADLYYQAGYVAARLGKSNLAMEYLDKAVSKNPKLLEANYELGEVLSNPEVRDYESALRSYGEVINLIGNEKTRGPRKQYYLNKIVAKVKDFYAKGLDEEVIELSDKILVIDPRNSIVRFNKDKSSVRLGLPVADELNYVQNLVKEANNLAGPEIAIDASNQLIKINDQDPSYHYSKGVALLKLKKYEEAVASLVTATNLDQEDSNSQYQAGIALARSKKYPQALQYLQRAVSLNSDNILAQAELGDVSLEMKNYTAAFDAYSKALSIATNDPNHQSTTSSGFVAYRLQQIAGKVSYFYQSGNYEMVIGLTEKLFDINPEDAALTTLREKALFRSGSNFSSKDLYEQVLYQEMNEFSAKRGYGKALDSCNHLLELHPQDATLYAQKGSFLSSMNRHGEAAQAFETAIKINPKDAELHYRAGHEEFFRMMSDREKAKSHLRSAVFLDPNHIKAYIDLATISEGNNRQSSIVFYDKALDLLINGKVSKDDPWLTKYENRISNKLNSFLQKEGKEPSEAKDATLELSQKFLKLKPQASEIILQVENALFRIGSKYMKEGDDDKAEKYFDKLLNFGVRKNLGNYELAKQYQSLGSNKKSLQCYDKELEINSESLTPAIRRSIYNGKADVLYAMGRYQGAIENYEISMAEKDSNYASTKRNIALCHLALGNFAQAASAFYEVGFSADESQKVPNNSPLNSADKSPSKLQSNTPNNLRGPSSR